MLGIYNSATLVSANINLRKSIQKIALESKLFDIVGQAEIEKGIQKSITKIIKDNDILRNLQIETRIRKKISKILDEVIRESKKKF